MRWFYILVLSIALTHTVSLQADDPTQAQAAVDAEKKNVDNSNKKFAEKYDEVKKAEEAYKKDPEGMQGEKTNKEILEEKKKELAEAALDKVNADSALKTAQDRMTKLKGNSEEEHAGHQSQGGSQQSGGKSEAGSAKDKAMAEALKQAAAQKQQEDQKKDQAQEENQAEQQQNQKEPTQTAKEEKSEQKNNQEEQVATIPEDIKKSLEAPYAKDEEPTSSSESQEKKSSSDAYDELIKANNELAAAKAKETFDTFASLNAEKETSQTEEAASEVKKTAKPVTVDEYIDGVAAQNSTKTRSPASSANRTTTSSVSPRAMKNTSSSRLLNSIK